MYPEALQERKGGREVEREKKEGNKGSPPWYFSIRSGMFETALAPEKQ